MNENNFDRWRKGLKPRQHPRSVFRSARWETINTHDVSGAHL